MPIKPNNQQKIAIIGSGFAGLSAACYLSKAGYEVDVYEKNEDIGGRARQMVTENGYKFDMGPSWYWMPDVFERFFADFGKKPSDFYELTLLDPGFSIVFAQNEVMDIPNDQLALDELFESIEKGSAVKLKQFLEEAAYKYKVGMDKLVYKPGLSITEFIDLDIFKGIFKLQLLTSFHKHVRKFFKHPKLIALMEFPILFLGATASDTPALYSLMNYAGLSLGTWYPKGGFVAVINAMKDLAVQQGVKFYTNETVQSFVIDDHEVTQLKSTTKTQDYDGIIAAADYHHIEEVLGDNYRNYNEKYWDKRVMAPSSLLFYLGVTKKIDKLHHHTLFFDEDLALHAEEIYTTPKWPSKPLFYVCCTSKTDADVAPVGHENVFILIPLAPNLEDTEELREKYYHIVMDRLEKFTGTSIANAIDYKKSYCITDFVSDYNAYKGNAYGLANTLPQTANLKPSIQNKKLANFCYAGQLTVPGPGVPPSIISGKVATDVLIKHLEKQI